MKVLSACRVAAPRGAGGKQMENKKAKISLRVVFTAVHSFFSCHKMVIWKLHSVKMRCESKLNSKKMCHLLPLSKPRVMLPTLPGRLLNSHSSSA